LSGIAAALWLVGLFAAAPAIRTTARYEFADRLRDALILGVAIPFALGLTHAFYSAACWCALAICIAAAYARGYLQPPKPSRAAAVPYVLLAALVAVGWPQLMRPLLDGDSLSYHLPNAASWVQAHSIWTTATRYWWYPPASELFAAGLYATSGPFALPWCGFGALALLGLRVTGWARETIVAPPLFADALGAAVVTAYPLAIQGGTLQNDVWLAAFWLESLWALRACENATAMRSLALTALIKPQGWVLAVIALATGRAGARLWLTTAGAFALWLVRDALLWKHAALGAAGTLDAAALQTSIAAHGLPALALLARVTLAISPFALAALVAALLGPLIVPRERRLGWAACGAALLFVLLPFGYATSVAQLAAGTSLRFAAPAIAGGAILLAIPARRASVALAIALLLGSTLFGVWYVLAIFWNDAPTHGAIAVAVAAVVVAGVAALRRTAWPNLLAFGLAVVAATHLAGRHALDYYVDALRVNGNATGIYRWISGARPAALGGWGMRMGVVNVLSPATRTVDLPDDSACGQAAADGVALAAVAQSELSPAANAARLHAARACGTARYADANAVVSQP
jgi:hypothetical protein